MIKDPYILEFLGLEENKAYLEHELEQGLIDNLQKFLLELGKGFCFVARQRRITIDGNKKFLLPHGLSWLKDPGPSADGEVPHHYYIICLELRRMSADYA